MKREWTDIYPVSIPTPKAEGIKNIRKKFKVIFSHSFLLLFSFAMAFPFIWLVLSSLKADQEIFAQPMVWFPKHLQWMNYVQAWECAPFGTFFVNSFIMSIGAVIGQLVTCSLAAYAFAQVNFRGKKILFVLVIASMMVPFEATVIPSYLVIKNMGLLNTYLGLIAPSLTSVFGIFLLRQFFMTIPRDLMDAARLDGCSHFWIFLHIAVPLARPVLATLGLFAFINAWTSYQWPLLITNSVDMRTVQIGLRYMVDDELGTQWPNLLAASTFIIIPIFVVFVFLQKYFVKGFMHTGLK